MYSGVHCKIKFRVISGVDSPTVKLTWFEQRRVFLMSQKHEEEEEEEEQ